MHEFQKRTNDFRNEMNILRKAVNVFNFNPDLKIIDQEWEILSMDYVEGETLFSLFQHNKLSNISLVKLFKTLWTLSQKGICHRDLNLQNLIQDASGNIIAVDYDNSIASTRFNAFLSNFFALGSMRGYDFCFVEIAKNSSNKVIILKLVLRVFYKTLNAIRNLLYSSKSDNKTVFKYSNSVLEKKITDALIKA